MAGESSIHDKTKMCMHTTALHPQLTSQQLNKKNCATYFDDAAAEKQNRNWAAYFSVQHMFLTAIFFHRHLSSYIELTERSRQ